MRASELQLHRLLSFRNESWGRIATKSIHTVKTRLQQTSVCLATSLYFFHVMEEHTEVVGHNPIVQQPAALQNQQTLHKLRHGRNVAAHRLSFDPTLLYALHIMLHRRRA
jgi:hypothetical protein